jgi:hypothetical protein
MACTRVEAQLLSFSASALGTETLGTETISKTKTLKCFDVTVSIIVLIND